LVTAKDSLNVNGNLIEVVKVQPEGGPSLCTIVIWSLAIQRLHNRCYVPLLQLWMTIPRESASLG